jgi:GT2 family glycosyltransferase
MSQRRVRRLVAVVVSYNRSALLEEVLVALHAQTVPPDAIVVVDNASSDDSVRVASLIAPKAHLVQLGQNTGGAGGFAVGIDIAIREHDADYVWVMDDDTVPTPTALGEMVRVLDSVVPQPAAVASRVVWHDGRDHPMNTPRERPFASRGQREVASSIGCMAVRSVSFVSSLFNAAAIRESGLPVADYFIWNDDFEFSSRILRNRLGLYCPSSVVVHKTKALASTDADPGERFYYEVRNKLWLFRRSNALGWSEKWIYVGASVRRWARTFRRSHDRGVLWRAFRRGLSDGFGTIPRSNRAVLGPVSGVPSEFGELFTTSGGARGQ